MKPPLVSVTASGENLFSTATCHEVITTGYTGNMWLIFMPAHPLEMLRKRALAELGCIEM
jgi:hypothetical protein